MALRLVKRQALLLPLLALAHAALIMFAVSTARDSRPAATVMAIEATAVASPILPDVEPALVEFAVPPEVAAPSFESASALSATGSGDCVIADQIRASLLESPMTQVALAAIPPESRTVANAIMLWDGRWTSLPGRTSVDGPTLLREIIVASIRAAPAGCQVAPNRGPRLIIVPDGAGSVVLAFGSGTWQWSELLV